MKKLNGLSGALLFYCLLSRLAWAEPFNPKADYTVCFTPGEHCTQTIVNTISSAKEQIDVQAYNFTSKPILSALITAAKHGVKVSVILDKSVIRSENNAADLLSANAIPVWIDERPSIAHNKVMIIDNHTVITGSFNFTKAAQTRNAENVLIIKDEGLAQHYERNWLKRRIESEPFAGSTLPFLDDKKPASDSMVVIKFKRVLNVLKQSLE